MGSVTPGMLICGAFVGVVLLGVGVALVLAFLRR